jgi:magnesium chelatase family protein
MLAQAHTFTIDGPEARHVTVELDVRPGLPAFAIVGLADTAVREARERIQAAIRNSGFEFPQRRITANLAPGDMPKAGPGLDLPIACAILAATGQVPAEPLRRMALYGELALDGGVRPARGTLAVAQAARDLGLTRIALAGARAREASLVRGLRVIVVSSLARAAEVLHGGRGDPLPRPHGARPESLAGPRGEQGSSRGGQGARTDAVRPRGQPDLEDVRGRHEAVGALVLAAAGAHNLLLSGPPGTGKTMIARRLPSILPPLGHEEAIEVMRVRSLLGLPAERLPRTRPFRAPHHSVTTAGLVGGASDRRFGEVVLAHRGVLFLDELSEFSHTAVESLRQPLEEGRVAIVRARRASVHPTRFMLIAATNPCPCGYGGEDRCSCSPADLTRHRRRLSGPLLDRIDLLVSLRGAPDGLKPGPLTSSASAAAQVLAARERQARRFARQGILVNAEMDARMIREHVRLDARGERILEGARRSGLLSGRGEHRLLRVARTAADLDGSQHVTGAHVGTALALRCDQQIGTVAA